jgi:integration host factor subunit beta
MKRSDIIRSIQVKFKRMRVSDAAALTDRLIEDITIAIARGDRIEIRGFGVFMPRARAAKSGYNPRTGAPMALPPGRTILFRPSPELTRQMNED